LIGVSGYTNYDTLFERYVLNTVRQVLHQCSMERLSDQINL